MIESAFPIISTRRLDRALEFWQEVLGGEVSFRFPDVGDPVYVGVDLGESHLGIGVDTDADPPSSAGRIAIWCYVADCDLAVERVRAAGFPVIEDPRDQPWGERVARVLDPDGNRVILGARM